MPTIENFWVQALKVVDLDYCDHLETRLRSKIKEYNLRKK